MRTTFKKCWHWVILYQVGPLWQIRNQWSSYVSWGWWDWPTVKKGTFAIPQHPHTSSPALNLITWSVKYCCFPCPLLITVCTPHQALSSAHPMKMCSAPEIVLPTLPLLASLLLGSDCLCFGDLVSVLKNSWRNRKEPRSPVLLKGRLCGKT